MEQDSLLLMFRDDDDGSGRLDAKVLFRGFAGESGAHFNISEVEKFADAIAKFPLAPGTPPMIRGGYWKTGVHGELDQEHLAISVYPVDSRGQIGVQVRLATDLQEDDRPESQSRVTLELLTTYEPLGRFSRQLRGLVRGREEEAILETDVLA